MKVARMYSLYRRLRNSPKSTKWERVSDISCKKETAIRWFQDRLIANALGYHEPDFEYRLRPVGQTDW